MSQDDEIAFLKEEFLATTDPIRSVEIADELFDIEGYGMQPFFISLLDLGNDQISLRNLAVAVLKKTGRNGAIAPLFQAVFNKDNENCNAVFIDALYTHDLTYSMADLFKILFHHEYDSKIAANKCLMDHDFSFSKPEILDMKKNWEDLQRNSANDPDYEISKPIIAEAVNKFLSYLDIYKTPSAGFTNIESEIEFLKNVILTEKWDESIRAIERLAWIGEDSALFFFISLLNFDNEKSDKRNLAAVGLKNIRDSRAVDPLFNTILKKENINYNGSMVYALESLSCGYKFKELFEILFHHGYEAKLHAYYILCKQRFAFDNDDLKQLQREWEEIKLNPELCLCYDDAKDMIQDALDIYLVYLEKQS